MGAGVGRDEAPLRWLVLSVAGAPPGEEHLLGDALRRAGARAVGRSGDGVEGWLPATSRPEAAARRAAAAIRASTSLRDPDISWSHASHDDWLARWGVGMEPRQLSHRIVVDPGNDPAAATPPPGAVVVRLPRPVAFGTADHPTTRASLRLLERALRPHDQVLDIGTGTGILAIAAVLLGARSALAVDSDPVACAAARANARASGVGDRVAVRRSRVTDANLPRLGRFQLVLANVEGEILQGLMGGVHGALAPGGRLIVAGAVVPEREALVGIAEAAGLQLLEEERDGGWWSALLACPAP
jgi:ribosomal protein L11 methyltransferase